MAYQIGEAVLTVSGILFLIWVCGSLGGNEYASMDRCREEAYMRARGII
ncbi:MAG: hypothetical protein Q8R30_02370 [bacterium]|nr:hypothetical protein [bacterium]